MKFSSFSRQIFIFLSGAIITLGLSVSLQSLLAAWAGPTANPPGDNVEEPLNAGIDPQQKAAGLILNASNGTTHGLIVSYGNVGIGDSSPSYKLDVTGAIRATSELISSTPNGVRLAYGNYGVIHRNDGANYYILLTGSGDSYGTYNALRPFRISDSTGDVSLGNSALYVDYSSGNTGIKTSSPGYPLQVNGDIYAYNAWLRTSGNTGWVNNTYGGGWYMADTTWVRSYDNKNIYTANEIRAGNFRDANDTGYNFDANGTSVVWDMYSKATVRAYQICFGNLNSTNVISCRTSWPDSLVVIMSDDCGWGGPRGCPAGYHGVGNWHTGGGKCDSLIEGTDYLGNNIDSGWMGLCVKN